MKPNQARIDAIPVGSQIREPRIWRFATPIERGLTELTVAHGCRLVPKPNPILGMGQTPKDARTVLTDLFNAGCDIVTITQHLRASLRRHPVKRWVEPEEFVVHEQFAKGPRRRRAAGRSPGPVLSYRRDAFVKPRATVRTASMIAGPPLPASRGKARYSTCSHRNASEAVWPILEQI